jgi:hypothetical protein
VSVTIRKDAGSDEEETYLDLSKIAERVVLLKKVEGWRSNIYFLAEAGLGKAVT